MDYIKENWVNVPDPLNPPEGAIPIDANIMDKIEQGIVEAYEFIEEKSNETKKEISALKENDAKFTPLFTALIGVDAATFPRTNCMCLSPNKQYIATVADDGYLRLYKTADMSIIGSVSLGCSSTGCRIDMDDEYIVACVAGFTNYVSTSGTYYFYKYTSFGITDITDTIGTTLTGRLAGHNPSRHNAMTCISGENNFWFVIEIKSDTYYTKRQLCRLNKASGLIAIIDDLYCGNLANSSEVWGTTGILRDGDGVYLWEYAQSTYNLSSTKADTGYAYVYHYDETGSRDKTLFSSTRSVGYNTGLPLVESMIIDVESQRVIIAGHSTYGSSEKIVAVYPFNGSLTSPSYTITDNDFRVLETTYKKMNYSDPILGVINGKLYAGGSTYDIDTLDTVATSVYVCIAPFASKSANMWDDTDTIESVYQYPIYDRIYFQSHEASSLKDGVAIIADEMEFGGMRK